jgi:hypothetical protein
MGAGKTKVISLRIEEELYRELIKHSQKAGGVAQYVREILYTFLYSSMRVEEFHKVLVLKSSKTSNILKQVEERKEEIEKSIEASRENIKQLEEMSTSISGVLNDLNRMVREGIEEIPAGGKR